MDWASDYSGGSNFIDLPSWDTQSDFPTFGGNDLMGQFDTGPLADTFDPWAGATWQNSMLSPEVTGSVNTVQPFPTPPGGYGNAGGGIPQPASAMNIVPPAGAANPWLAAALGAAGPFASLLGSLASGGVTSGTQYKPTVAQQANMGIGNQWAQMGAQGQLPLQQQQASLLGAIMSGQGLAQPYAQAVERAYEPQLGSLYSQAADAGRSRGFYDAPATSPPGGAILGPGLSDLQGQIAASKLNLMQSLPALYNQPINNQGTFAQNYLGAAQRAPINQQQTQPIGAQIGQGIGNVIGGVAQGYGQYANQQQQMANQAQSQQTNSLLQQLLRNSGQTNMSGSPYEFSQY